MQRRFSLDDSRAFASLSGDGNPLHVDPLAARRSAFGRPVVHGMHLVLQGLEILAAGGVQGALRSLRGAFLQAVCIDDPVSFEWEPSGGGSRTLRIVGDRLAAKVDVAVGEDEVVDSTWQARDVSDELEEPKVRSFDGLRTAVGQVRCRVNADAFRSRFPHASEAFPIDQLAALATTSTLVGMECPGLHSIYSRFDLKFGREMDPHDALDYRVERADERFRLLSMAVAGMGCEGRVEAFVRPEPRKQLSLHEAGQRVIAGEFSGRRALVIGGSRGLGEVAAKLLAAGGAEVAITFARGAEDARRVVDELGEAMALPLALPAEAADLKALADRLPESWQDLEVLFFATPPITAGRACAFDDERYRRYADIYVHSVDQLMAALQASGRRIGHLLNPSSVFVETAPPSMAEYVAAKRETEALAATLEQANPGLRVSCPRWPRLATDQTASTVPEKFADAGEVILQSVRELFAKQVP